MVQNIREHHDPIVSEDCVVADAGLISTRPNTKMVAGGVSLHRESGFDRIDSGSPLGVLAERISFTNQADICLTREGVVEVLRAVRLQ